jgi:hypothetical protein
VASLSVSPALAADYAPAPEANTVVAEQQQAPSSFTFQGATQVRQGQAAVGSEWPWSWRSCSLCRWRETLMHEPQCNNPKAGPRLHNNPSVAGWSSPMLATPRSKTCCTCKPRIWPPFGLDQHLPSLSGKQPWFPGHVLPQCHCLAHSHPPCITQHTPSACTCPPLSLPTECPCCA